MLIKSTREERTWSVSGVIASVYHDASSNIRTSPPSYYQHRHKVTQFHLNERQPLTVFLLIASFSSLKHFIIFFISMHVTYSRDNPQPCERGFHCTRYARQSNIAQACFIVSSFHAPPFPVLFFRCVHTYMWLSPALSSLPIRKSYPPNYR